jgi:ABC transporter substrate binding protein
MTVVSSQLSVSSKNAGEKTMTGKILFSLLVTILLMTAPPTEAQQTLKIHRIGFLSGGFPGTSHWTTTLRTDLRELGYVEGKNIAIESRFAENKPDRLPALADELVRLKVDVIVAGGTNDARAARNTTKTIPIVMAGIGIDPVEAGLVESLARPGGTGRVFLISTPMVGSRLATTTSPRFTPTTGFLRLQDLPGLLVAQFPLVQQLAFLFRVAVRAPVIVRRVIVFQLLACD